MTKEIEVQLNLPVRGMTAKEARAILTSSKKYQAELQAAITRGERSLNRALAENKPTFHNGLHALNPHLWDDGIKHWEGLGFRIEWQRNKGKDMPSLCSF